MRNKSVRFCDYSCNCSPEDAEHGQLFDQRKFWTCHPNIISGRSYLDDSRISGTVIECSFWGELDRNLL